MKHMLHEEPRSRITFTLWDLWWKIPKRGSDGRCFESKLHVSRGTPNYTHKELSVCCLYSNNKHGKTQIFYHIPCRPQGTGEEYSTCIFILWFLDTVFWFFNPHIIVTFSFFNFLSEPHISFYWMQCYLSIWNLIRGIILPILLIPYSGLKSKIIG